MPTLPTVAVIGAGSSGIAAAKALHERGVPFTCFEASDRVGGNWVFGNKNGMSAAYRQLFINTSRDRMEYSDYPMPKSYPDFPHHTQIAAYFDAYVDHFGFRDRIRFETKVARGAASRRRRLGADARRRLGGALRRPARGQRPPLGPALARADVPGPRELHRPAAPRPRLPRQRPVRRQGRGRARDGQLGHGHRGRGLLRRTQHVPGRATRGVDHPQVHVRPARRPAPAATRGCRSRCASA